MSEATNQERQVWKRQEREREMVVAEIAKVVQLHRIGQSPELVRMAGEVLDAAEELYKAKSIFRQAVKHATEMELGKI